MVCGKRNTWKYHNDVRSRSPHFGKPHQQRAVWIHYRYVCFCSPHYRGSFFSFMGIFFQLDNSSPMQSRYCDSQHRPRWLTHFEISHGIFPGGYLSRWNEDSFGSLSEGIGKVVGFPGWRPCCGYRLPPSAEKCHQ